MLTFRKLILHNWKNFEHLEINLADRMFVVGANASGKSNLLDAFRFFADLTHVGFRRAVAARGGLRKLCYINAGGERRIDMRVELFSPGSGEALPMDWSYELSYEEGNAANEPVVYAERILRGGEPLLGRQWDDAGEDALTRQYTHLEQPAIHAPYRPLFDCFRGISYVNIIPQVIREADAFAPSSVMDDYYGHTLLSAIAELPKKERSTRLRAISSVLRMAVPQFESITYVQDEKGRPHLKVIYRHFASKEMFQLEDQLSDGTLRLIGMLWAILGGGGLLLLEEPELYLHTTIIRQLPAFIARAQLRKDGALRQVLISTHSFDLLDSQAMDADEVIVLRKDAASTEACLAGEIESVRLKLEARFTMADAVIPLVSPAGMLDGHLSGIDFH